MSRTFNVTELGLDSASSLVYGSGAVKSLVDIESIGSVIAGETAHLDLNAESGVVLDTHEKAFCHEVECLQHKEVVVADAINATAKVVTLKAAPGCEWNLEQLIQSRLISQHVICMYFDGRSGFSCSLLHKCGYPFTLFMFL